MGKSAPAQPTNTTVTQTNLPEYLKGPVLDAVGRAQGIANEPYTPYPNQRIADFTGAQNEVNQNIMGMETPGQFAFGSGLAAAAGQGSLDMANYQPGQFNVNQVNPGAIDPMRMNNPQMFGQQQADQYMSPYMQNVIDVSKNEAIRDAEKTQMTADLGAARQGTYGGSRQLLAGLERERNLNRNLGDMQTRGLQMAYENAQSQFGQDRNAQMNADSTNLQAGLGQQRMGYEGDLQAQGLNQQYGLEGQRLGEQSRQFGASQGLAALGQAGQMGQTLGNLGQYQQNADMQRYGMQGDAARMYQAQEQARMDQDHADFLGQRDWGKENLAFTNSIIRGLPSNVSSSAITYAPRTNPMSMLSSGLGSLAGASLYGGG
jgi:hypothetical protein